MGISIRFSESMITLEPDAKNGFKAIHHCDAFNGNEPRGRRAEMDFLIGEGTGGHKFEFHSSLECPTCHFTILFTTSFVRELDRLPAVVGERILRTGKVKPLLLVATS